MVQTQKRITEGKHGWNYGRGSSPNDQERKRILEQVPKHLYQLMME
jgi:hypothetical protein